MLCPRCGAPRVRCLDTRMFRDPTADFHYVERKRACNHCEMRFQTIEVSVGTFLALRNGELKSGVDDDGSPVL